MSVQNPAGFLIETISRRNGLKNNREISKYTNTNYELVNRGLREDSQIGDTFLKNFLKSFDDITIEEEKIIRIEIELAKSSNLLREEFRRMKMTIENFKEEQYKTEAEEIFADAFKYAIEKGLAKAILNKV